MNQKTTRGLLWAAGAAGAALALRAGYRRLREADIAGCVVLITGGSRGLGLSMARAFGAEGCRVAICARNTEELDRACRDLEARGIEVIAVPCDVTDRAQVDGLAQSVLRHFGRVDILVNNAGIIQVGPVESMTLEDFEQAMAVMFWGVVYPTLALLPHFLGRGAGRIVNITSIGGKVSVPHLLPYNCAKFAAVGFSEGLRAELAGRGVRVTTIAPGLMRTGSYLNGIFKGDPERESLWFGVSANLPLATIGGSRAARQIVAAVKRGDAERVLTAPANLMARFHGLFPGATADLLGLVNRLVLPAPTGRRDAMPGSEISSLESRGARALTALGRSAGREFLQPQYTPSR
ncbi:MAG: SDR family NAD(P)-dependent oxidoreductase [Bryobacteraceae bacterium]